MDNSENKKLIVKNTALLYFRMLLTMAVALYTSRVVLATLGVEDFGIYNVVGGVVTMFGFINSAMTTGTQRFLSFELGKRDFNQMAKVFSMSINIHAIIAFLILVLAETIGLWFLNSQLTIPAERLSAARWVFHFSIASFMVTIMSVPYNALIVSHERMHVYAYVSIIDVSLKLGIVFLLQFFGFDKLKLYAVLVFLVTVSIRIIYGFYSKVNFAESKYKFLWNKELFKSLVSFSGWNLWGTIAGVSFNQGVNILLNIFFGPIVNAARGVAYQVDGAVEGFVRNFQMALNPQIVKSYASGDKNYMFQLVNKGAKYSFFLLLVLSLPILMETEMILDLWLKKVPEHTVIFCRLILINALINSISGPLMTSAQASGNLKLYQSFVGGLLILNLPFSYLFLWLGFPPEVTLIISIVISIIALISRLLILRGLVKLPLADFAKQVIWKVLLVLCISMILPGTLKIFLDEGLLQSFMIVFVSIASVSLSVFVLGLTIGERNIVILKIRSLIHKNGNYVEKVN